MKISSEKSTGYVRSSLGLSKGLDKGGHWGEYIKHIFAEGELDKESVVRKFRTTADDGKNYDVTYYNLEVF